MQKAQNRMHPTNRIYILQPIGIAIMPVLSLMANNVDRVGVDWVIRPFMIYIAVAILLLIAIRKFSKDWRSAALTSSLLLIVILQFGRLPALLTSLITELFGSTFAGIQEEEHRILLSAIFLLPILLVFAILFFIRKRPRCFRAVEVLIYLILLSSIATSAIFIGRHILTLIQFENARDSQTTSNIQVSGDIEEFPDVYYLILDGYARADVLQDIYAYDNSAFLDFLEQEDCYVGMNSIANYTKTILSLVASLNLDYVQNVITATEPRTIPASVFSSYLNQSRVIQIFQELGYEIVTFESGFSLTDITAADYHLDPIIHGLNPFESILLSQSVVVYPAEISLLFNRMAFGISYSGHIARQRYILDTLPALDLIPSPKFVFAHIILPHPPFVFQEDGQVIIPDLRFSYLDADDYEGSMEGYRAGYVSQLSYLNRVLEGIIEGILSKPESAVILLQADHGPRSMFTWKSPSPEGIYETFSIFNAYCLPRESHAILYPEISPVNSFRLLFSHYFDMDYPLLPDESYYAYYWNTLDLLERISD